MTITALVQFQLPEGMSRKQVMTAFRASLETLRGYPGLVRKHYLYSADGVAIGAYLWESREAAEALYTAEWRQTVAARYGSAPTITWFETPIVLDNVSGEVIGEAAA